MKDYSNPDGSGSLWPFDAGRRALGIAAMSTAATGGIWPCIANAGRGQDAGPAGRPSDFPALQQRIGDSMLVYLDSAATTMRPVAVIEALAAFYREDNSNPGAALHALARRAADRYERARRTVASFVNAASADEIVWARGTTEAINLVATCWGRTKLRPGDEILLTIAEHASNLLPWRLAAAGAGAELRFAAVDAYGRVLLDDLERKLSPRTRLVAFSHVSNVAGYVNPAAEICAIAHRAGAMVLVDAAQSVPHLSVDVHAMDCDFLAFSSHKMLGPMGIGALWARRELLDAMPPYQSGSNMAHDVDVDGETLEQGARKFGAGTPNVSGAIGLEAAVNYLNAIGRDSLQRHESQLTAYGLERLQAVPGLRILGPQTPEQRIPVFSFTMDALPAAEILKGLDALGIAIRAGDLAARPLLRHLGTETAARASCYLYTSIDDIDRLVAALQRLAAKH